MSYIESRGCNSPSLTHFTGPFIRLQFQDGPIQEHGVNGTTNEEVIELLVERIKSLNEMAGGMYSCKENAMAITHLETALAWLTLRTARRQQRGVEGTTLV